MTSLPYWLQFLVAVAAVVGTFGGVLAFLFVIWPSIRKQEKVGEKLEAFVDRLLAGRRPPQGAVDVPSLIEALGDDLEDGGDPQ